MSINKLDYMLYYKCKKCGFVNKFKRDIYDKKDDNNLYCTNCKDKLESKYKHFKKEVKITKFKGFH